MKKKFRLTKYIFQILIFFYFEDISLELGTLMYYDGLNNIVKNDLFIYLLMPKETLDLLTDWSSSVLGSNSILDILYMQSYIFFN